MGAELQRIIDERIAAENGITVAAFMDLALYHPEFGYYAGRAQRSGRGGDFYTSVDVGPLFGACIARALCARWRGGPFDLVEAAAGNGRLSRDILDAAADESSDFYAAVRLHLVERSAAARAAQHATLGPHAGRLASSGPDLPAHVDGAIVANELLDAMPAHLLEMTPVGMRELFVVAGRTLEPRPVSDARIERQLTRAGARLDPGWRAEVSVEAADWTARAARALRTGTLLLFDYGHEARALYSAPRAAGTLLRYSAHGVDDRFLEDAGDADLTTHVDFTTVRLAAEAEGLRVTAFTSQSDFLLRHGLVDRLPTGRSLADVRLRLQARSLVSPEGLGGTIKVMVLERPA